jgi:hypothetical protein
MTGSAMGLLAACVRLSAAPPPASNLSQVRPSQIRCWDNEKALAPATMEPLFPGADLILCHKSVYRISETHIELTVPETRDFEIDLTVIQALEDGNVAGRHSMLLP